MGELSLTIPGMYYHVMNGQTDINPYGATNKAEFFFGDGGVFFAEC